MSGAPLLQMFSFAEITNVTIYEQQKTNSEQM